MKEKSVINNVFSSGDTEHANSHSAKASEHGRSTILRVLAVSFTCALALLQTACFQKAEISGQVFDQSGKPLDGVQVEIIGTSYSTESDSSGKYSIPYSPGRFELTHRKPGYSSSGKVIELATETKHPVADVVLILYPENDSVAAFSTDVYEAMSAGTVRKVTQKHEFSSSIDAMLSKSAYTDTFFVAGDVFFAGLPSDLGFVSSKGLRFAIYRVDEDGAILRFDRGQTTALGSDREFVKVDSERYNLGNDISAFFPKEKMEKGLYALISEAGADNALMMEMMGGQAPIGGTVFLFEIGESSTISGKFDPMSEKVSVTENAVTKSISGGNELDAHLRALSMLPYAPDSSVFKDCLSSTLEPVLQQLFSESNWASAKGLLKANEAALGKSPIFSDLEKIIRRGEDLDEELEKGNLTAASDVISGFSKDEYNHKLLQPLLDRTARAAKEDGRPFPCLFDSKEVIFPYPGFSSEVKHFWISSDGNRATFLWGRSEVITIDRSGNKISQAKVPRTFVSERRCFADERLVVILHTGMGYRQKGTVIDLKTGNSVHEFEVRKESPSSRLVWNTSSSGKFLIKAEPDDDFTKGSLGINIVDTRSGKLLRSIDLRSVAGWDNSTQKVQNIFFDEETGSIVGVVVGKRSDDVWIFKGSVRPGGSPTLTEIPNVDKNVWGTVAFDAVNHRILTSGYSGSGYPMAAYSLDSLDVVWRAESAGHLWLVPESEGIYRSGPNHDLSEGALYKFGEPAPYSSYDFEGATILINGGHEALTATERGIERKALFR